MLKRLMKHVFLRENFNGVIYYNEEKVNVITLRGVDEAKCLLFYPI